jgi:uncharacterized damage-inducible protein DinB
MDVKLLTEYLIWGDAKIIKILEQLDDDEFNRNFGELTGNIHSKTAHIVSVYDFFIKILEGKPYNNFPDLTGLSKVEILEKWRNVVRSWPEYVNNIKQGLYGLPLANGQRVDVEHIFLDAIIHTVHHRAQILTFIRLLGKSKDEIHPRDTNLDYLMFLFSEHQDFIHPAQK